MSIKLEGINQHSHAMRDCKVTMDVVSIVIAQLFQSRVTSAMISALDEFMHVQRKAIMDFFYIICYEKKKQTIRRRGC